jgi:hypothetical protein
MEADDLQLAISYADLATSVAFKDFLSFQRSECERLEQLALNAPATDFEAARSSIIAWQQRRLVIRTLEETVRDSAQAIKSMELENQDERSATASDRASRSGW